MAEVVRPGSRGALWLSYFFTSIAIIGTLGVLLDLPLFALGVISPKFRRWSAHVFQRGVWLLLWVQPWLKTDVKLKLKLKSGDGTGTLIVSNHRSTLDVFLLLANVPGIRILAKQSLARIPFLHLAMRLTRQLFIPEPGPDGLFKAMDRVQEELAKGECIHVFPEMTRCVPGFVGTQRFSLAPFRAAFLAKAPIVPLAIGRTDLAWPKGVYGLASPSEVRARALPVIQSQSYGSATELMAAVQEAINDQLRTWDLELKRGVVTDL